MVSRANPILAALLFLGFIVYETDEDWHISNGAYRDILTYLIGLYGTAALSI